MPMRLNLNVTSEVKKFRVSKARITETAKKLSEQCLAAANANDSALEKKLLTELAKLNMAIEYIEHKIDGMQTHQQEVPKVVESQDEPIDLKCYL